MSNISTTPEHDALFPEKKLKMSWTPERIEELRNEWATGTPIKEIGKKMGVGKENVNNQARVLGLPVRRPRQSLAPNITWTPELITILREDWAAGDSSQKIANRIGTSKHSVIGKAHRLGLPGRESPIKPKPKPVRAEPAPETANLIAEFVVEVVLRDSEPKPVKVIKKRIRNRKRKLNPTIVIPVAVAVPAPEAVMEVIPARAPELVVELPAAPEVIPEAVLVPEINSEPTAVTPPMPAAAKVKLTVVSAPTLPSAPLSQSLPFSSAVPCRWPTTYGTKTHRFECTEVRLSGRAYCEEHCRAAYRDWGRTA